LFGKAAKPLRFIPAYAARPSRPSSGNRHPDTEPVMSNVLLIHSSVFGDKSQSLALARDFLKCYPHRSVVERALSPQTMPHLDDETFVAMGTSGPFGLPFRRRTAFVSRSH
jgi:hypothetical protein